MMNGDNNRIIHFQLGLIICTGLHCNISRLGCHTRKGVYWSAVLFSDIRKLPHICVVCSSVVPTTTTTNTAEYRAIFYLLCGGYFLFRLAWPGLACLTVSHSDQVTVVVAHSQSQPYVYIQCTYLT